MMNDLRFLVEKIRDAHDCNSDFIVGLVIEELEELTRPPDPPQVHIPGLDQTEWK